MVFLHSVQVLDDGTLSPSHPRETPRRFPEGLFSPVLVYMAALLHPSWNMGGQFPLGLPWRCVQYLLSSEPVECSPSLPVLQSLASHLCHNGWPPFCGIFDGRSCHMPHTWGLAWPAPRQGPALLAEGWAFIIIDFESVWHVNFEPLLWNMISQLLIADSVHLAITLSIHLLWIASLHCRHW